MNLNFNDLKQLREITVKTETECTVITISNSKTASEQQVKIDSTKEVARANKPTVEELKKFCSEKNLVINYQKFIDYYNSKDWTISGIPMKDWKSSVLNWFHKDNPKK